MDTVTGPGYVGIEWTRPGTIGSVDGQTGAIDDMFAWMDQAGGALLSLTYLPLVYSASFGTLLPRHLFGAEASYETNTGYCRLRSGGRIEGLSEIDLSEWTADPIGFLLSFASGEDLTSVAVDTMSCVYCRLDPAPGESFTGLSLSWNSVYTRTDIAIFIDDCGLDQSTLHSLIDDIEAGTSPTTGYFYIGGTNAGIDAAHAAVLATWTSAGVTVDYNAA